MSEDSIDVIVVRAINRHATFDFGVGFFASGRFVARKRPRSRNMSYVTPTSEPRF